MINVNTIQLKRIDDEKGSLTPIEATRDIPFEIKRVYYIYNVPGEKIRGFHSHKALHQVLVCVNGSVDIICEDKNGEKATFILDKPNKGLYVGPMVWREMTNFSKDSVLLVFASEFYDVNDYIRDYNDFLDICKPTSST